MKHLLPVLCILMMAAVSHTQTLQQQTDTIGYGWHVSYHNPDLQFGSVTFPSPHTGWAIGGFTFAKSTDGGVSWATVTPPAGAIGGLFTTDSNGYFLSNTIIYVTTNAGLSWIPRVSGVSGVLTHAVFPSHDTGYAMTDEYVSRTTDAGQNWKETIVPLHLACIAFADNKHGFVGGSIAHFDPDPRKPDVGVLAISNDAGQTWTQIFTGIHRDFQSLYALNGQTIIAGLSEGAMGRSTDGGHSWDTTVVLARSGDLISGISFADSTHGLVVGSNGLIAYTSDAGRNWIKQNSGTNLQLASVQFLSNSTAFVSGDSGYVLTTRDAGQSWVSNQEHVPDLGLQVYPSPANSQVQFQYALRKTQHVSFTIINIDGIEVAHPLESALLRPGPQQVNLNTSSLPSGTYVYQLTSEDYARTGQFIITR